MDKGKKKQKTKVEYYQEFVQLCATVGSIVIGLTYDSAGAEIKVKCRRAHYYGLSRNRSLIDPRCPTCIKIDETGELPIEVRNARYLECVAKAASWRARVTSLTYEGPKVPMNLICGDGHYITEPADNIRLGKVGKVRCKECNRKVKLNKPMSANEIKLFLDCKSRMEARGWIMLSDRYIDKTSPLRYHCRNGHHGVTTRVSLLNGTGCPDCSGLSRTTIELIKDLVESKEGTILEIDMSEKLSQSTRVKIKCSCSNIWKPRVADLKKDRWCPLCAGVKRWTIEEIKEHMIGRTIILLSTEYKSTSKKLKWKCLVCQYIWNSISSSVVRLKCGCPNCAGTRKWTIEEVHELVKERGGRTNLIEHKSISTKFEIFCRDAHKFFASVTGIIQGCWCPYCRMTSGENSCYQTLKDIGVESEAQYVLDGVRGFFDLHFFYNNKEYLLEFDGIQHFIHVAYFNNTDEKTLEVNQGRDLRKTIHAISKGIFLIRIDYKQKNNVKYHILEALKSSEKYYFSTPEMYKYLTGNFSQVLDPDSENEEDDLFDDEYVESEDEESCNEEEETQASESSCFYEPKPIQQIINTNGLIINIINHVPIPSTNINMIPSQGQSISQHNVINQSQQNNTQSYDIIFPTITQAKIIVVSHDPNKK